MNEKEKDKVDINDFIDVQLNYLQIAFIVRNTSLMIFLTIKVFLFGFKDADRKDIVTEEDKVTEEQDIRDYESKLKEELSSDAEKA